MKLAGLFLALFSMGTLTMASPTKPTLQYRDLEWVVQVTPDRNVTLSGTVEEVHAELLRLNPNWEGEHAVAARETEGLSLTSKRDDRLGPFSSYYCGGPWPYQVTASFWEGFRYLQRIQGQVHMSPGPGACGRVSCSYGSAIVLCNDHTEDFYLDSWNMVADGATRLMGLCTTLKMPPLVAGQIFHPDRWNIILRQESC